MDDPGSEVWVPHHGQGTFPIVELWGLVRERRSRETLKLATWGGNQITTGSVLEQHKNKINFLSFLKP